jgi:hypothetical protein
MTLPSERTSRAIRSGRMNRRPPSFVVTLVALALVFGLAWMFFLRSSPSAPTPVVSGVQGTYTWDPGTGRAREEGAFSAVAGGNAGGEATAPGGTAASGHSPPASAYDAATRTETTVGDGLIGWYAISRGEWPPVWRVATRSPLDYRGLSAVVRSAVEDRDDAVGIKPLKDGDRAVWRAAMTLGGQPVELVVDQQTGIVTWYTDGRATFTASVDWASPPSADKTYTIDTRGLPARTATGDVTYAASPAAAGRTAGYDPLVSDLAPDGYSLKAVATFDGNSRVMIWVRGVAVGPPSDGPDEPGVALLFTRGLTSMTVEQIGPKATRYFSAALLNALDSAARHQLSYQETTLQYGAFKGATASTWYQESGPSLFVAGQRRAVFVTGALTRQELIAFAEGLKPVPADASR